MPLIDRHLVSPFFLCSLQVIQCPTTSSGFSGGCLLYHSKKFYSNVEVKTPVLLGSSSSIADSKAVNETLEGNFDEGPALVECFEFENSGC